MAAAALRRLHPLLTTMNGMSPNENYHTWPSAEEALSGQGDINIAQFPLRDPNFFVAKQLGNHITEWERLLATSEPDMADTVRPWLTQGVSVQSFFQPFKGSFKGVQYDLTEPPAYYQGNSASCATNAKLVAQTLEERLKNGSLQLLGRWDELDETQLPHCIMPLTLDPKKERLCHDERFLNLFIEDSPFKLDTLREVPRMLQEGDTLINTDEKSGYDHVALASNSFQYFGLMFNGWVMTYTTLPFGFKPACFIYQSIGMIVSSYLRSLGVPILQYIDDRLVVVGRTTSKLHPDNSIYAVLQLMHRLGYTFSLSKCCLTPTTTIRFLGFVLDSVARTFSVPQDKKEDFCHLLDSMLAKSDLDLLSLQALAGKCSSMAIAVPGAMFYTRELNTAISAAMRSGQPVRNEGALRAELEHWCFMKSWQGVAQWKRERHLALKIATDASGFKWAGKLLSGNSTVKQVSDYFLPGDDRPIHQKETEAVAKTLLSLGNDIKQHRIDVLTDSMALIGAWRREGSRNASFNDILKQLFHITLQFDLELNLQYVNTKENPADAPSRSLSRQDAKLAGPYWRLVDDTFGPHTCDLMALDSNCAVAEDGSLLRHFTPYPTPLSAGVNVFAQNVGLEHNPYVFPPLSMIPPLLAFLQESAVPRCTVLLPSKPQRDPWWPKVLQYSTEHIQVAYKGDQGVLWYPSKRGWHTDTFGLPWDLLAFRMSFPAK